MLWNTTLRNTTLRNTKLSTTILATVLALLAIPGFATEEDGDSEGKAILQKAGEAAIKVKSARFTGTLEPTGMAKAFVASMNGTALIDGWDESMQKPARFFVDIEATPPGAEDSQKLTGGGNGETYFLVDHSGKKAYEDIDPGVLGSNNQTLEAFSLVQFVHPEPYQRDLASESVELLGKKEVAGEECYEIKVTYPPDSAEAGSTWYISTRDYFPRSRIRHFVVPQRGEGSIVTTLTKLEIDPDFEPSLFRLKLPQGYEQVDDFAP